MVVTCRARCIFASGGCSAERDVVDCGQDGLLVYGSGRNVLLRSLSSPGWSWVLGGNAKDQVHSIRILWDEEGRTVGVVAGAADGTLRIWKRRKGENLKGEERKNPEEWEGDVVVRMEGSVISIAVAPETTSPTIWNIVFCDTTGVVGHFQWSCMEGRMMGELKRTSFSPKKVISVGITVLSTGISSSSYPSTHPLLIAALSDGKIVLLVGMRAVLALEGHQNWTNSIDCTLALQENAIYMATGSSDRTIRIWRICRCNENKDQKVNNQYDGLVELVPVRNTFEIDKNVSFMVSCEAILDGHENGIHSVRWSRTIQRAALSERAKGLQLVSAAADHMLFVWQPALGGGWRTVVRLGDISGIGAVGGDRSFGFFSGLHLEYDEMEWIIAHGSTGSIVPYVRKREKGEGGMPSDSFKPREPLAGGHTAGVEGCSWDPLGGNYLHTVSLDKTTRTWACWPGREGDWREVARPQIHGYEMRTIRAVNEAHFLSAGDEKILRAFQAPASFLHRLAIAKGAREGEADFAPFNTTSCGTATLPALGLSNRSTDASEHHSHPPPEASLSQAPTESDLSRWSLWVETDKLYGHVQEVYALAISHDGTLAASSSKATTSQDAHIRLWRRGDSDGRTWKSLAFTGTIALHTLTVVKLAFSPDDRHLLAVSRDRHWSLTAIKRENGLMAESMNESKDAPITESTEKSTLLSCHPLQYKEGHGRIIWSASWAPDASFFVTVSRDRTAKTWKESLEKGRWIEIQGLTLTLESGITAVSIHPQSHNGYLMALGQEDGTICIYQRHRGGPMEDKWILLLRMVGCQEGPCMAVNELEWRPIHPYELAAVSADHTVRIYQIDLEELDGPSKS